MGTITTSMLVILLIFGFGLVGASYNTCQSTLENNGYYLTDSEYQSFYEAANDPDNISFINNNYDYLDEQWNSVSSVPINPPDYDHDNVESVPTNPPDYDHDNVESFPLYGESLVNLYVDFLTWAGKDFLDDYTVLSTVDNSYVESSTSNVVSYYPYGSSKIISDGHGGYYVAILAPSSVGGITYTVTHYDADGNKKELCRCYNGMPEAYDYLHFDFYVDELDDGSQQVIVKNTYRMSEDDEFKVNTYESTVEFLDEKTEEIEEKKTGDVVTVPINPDGSITLPDGTVIYPNADGTYTIDGVDYPVTDTPIDPTTIDPTELLKQLLAIQEKVDEAQDDFTFEDSQSVAEEVIDSSVIDEAAAAYSGNLSEFLLSSRITQIFPFCLPFDFVRGLKLLSKSPVPPKFDIDFDIPAFGAYPGSHDVISLDFSVYSKYFTVMRWVTTILFIFSLTFLTYKLIKW